ncbi:MAG: nitric oxide reductase transcriptional regulator NorR [Gammaproteobacteria bacterium]|nr:nitric oxide reductase transcriptional regulator NorR [Gammaproteobacteria bacterium]
MTTAGNFSCLAGIVSDLTRSMPSATRYERLLGAFRSSFPCDAIALLELDNDVLIPRAVQGFSRDTLGRRFTVTDHPRLEQVLDSRSRVRFPADSSLPDPFDGLVDHADGHLYVHDCMGVALHIDGEPWGVLTLDAMSPGQFDAIDHDVFDAFASVAAATVRAADWIRRLELQLERHHQLNRSTLQEALPDELIGRSEAILRLQREAQTVASSDLPVLILGETGVGKELVARLIHQHSARAEEPMVHLNCAALPESLAESELFGHVRGAFSGATDDRLGKFELAHEGTLFLDEVGELPPAVQAKLLRALQSGEVQRLGCDNVDRVDVRVIAATNRDLKQEVLAGRFRLDLYHRLSVYPLLVPPLRERGDDVLLLAGYFLERRQRQLGVRGARLSDAARRWLHAYSWPGNVREVEHAVSRAIVRALTDGHAQGALLELTPRHLGSDEFPELTPPPESDAAPSGSAADEPAACQATLQDAVDAFRRDLIARRIDEHGGNCAAAARSLGMDRGNFHRLLKRLSLR